MTALCLILLICLPTADPPLRDAPPDAQISTVDGATMSVRITSIESDVLHYRSAGKEAEIALADLERITPAASPASPKSSAKGSVCSFHFADNGWIEGRLLPTRDPADRRIHIDAGWPKPLAFRLDALSAVRFSGADHAAADAEFNARLKNRAAGRDLLIVPQGANAVVIPGALERLEPDQWTFRIGDKLQSATLDKAFGVILGGVTSQTTQGNVLIELAGRHRIAAQRLAADASTLHIVSEAFGSLDLPWSDVSSIALRSARVAYLSDLEPSKTTQRSLFDVAWPPRKDANVTGGPLVIDQRRFSKGLGVHAYTALTYKLEAKYARLIATIGLDDSAADGGSAVFRVRGDDRTLFESKPLSPRRSEAVNLDLRGVRELTLECDGGEDLDLAVHGDWADARLIRASPDRTH